MTTKGGWDLNPCLAFTGLYYYKLRLILRQYFLKFKLLLKIQIPPEALNAQFESAFLMNS